MNISLQLTFEIAFPWKHFFLIIFMFTLSRAVGGVEFVSFIFFSASLYM